VSDVLGSFEMQFVLWFGHGDRRVSLPALFVYASRLWLWLVVMVSILISATCSAVSGRREG
jgi:hypothetical protein